MTEHWCVLWCRPLRMNMCVIARWDVEPCSPHCIRGLVICALHLPALRWACECACCVVVVPGAL